MALALYAPGLGYYAAGDRQFGMLPSSGSDFVTAPELKLTTTSIHKPDGTPAYCSDALEWRKEEWIAPQGKGLFETMAAAFYAMLHRSMTEGAPLEITPQQVRQQIAVMEEAHRQAASR